MSRRNSREGKARRRAERAARRPSAEASADVHTYGELVAYAQRGEQLPCGCDAHQALHDMIAFERGEVPEGYQQF